jgi:sulfide:quinone oxidoreductase
MPIKCAGAPQKACTCRRITGVAEACSTTSTSVFYNAGGCLFGVKEYVPALMEYIEKYNARPAFGHRLTRIDGEQQTAWFETVDEPVLQARCPPTST